MNRCPACSQSVAEPAVSCPACGAALVDSAEPTRAQLPPAAHVGAQEMAVGRSPTAAPTSAARDQDRFVAGTVLAGRYRIIGSLGRGGMGEVYLAHDTRLKRRVALKLLPAQFISDADRVRRFAQESRRRQRLEPTQPHHRFRDRREEPSDTLDKQSSGGLP